MRPGSDSAGLPLSKSPAQDGIPRAHSEPREEDRLIGVRIRLLRKERGLSIQTISDRSGLSTGMLSQIERGLTMPSIKSLRAIATTLDVPISWFFLPPAEDGVASPYVVRRSARRVLALVQNGVTKELLTPPEAGSIEVYEITLQALGTSGEDSYPHNGIEKAGFVLSGTLRLWLDNAVSILREGDSFRFPSRLAHRFDNPGPQPSRVIWIVANWPSPAS
jgi:transcriptional regulator with XRE-family HTH domain